MYELNIFNTIFFSLSIIVLFLFFIFAMISDKKKKKKLNTDIDIINMDDYYNCVKDSKKNNFDLQECLKKNKSLRNKINTIINFNNIKNESLTKKMINSSIQGVIQGSVFGFIISQYEGLFVGLILFAILNPLMTYIEHLLKIKSKI